MLFAPNNKAKLWQAFSLSHKSPSEPLNSGIVDWQMVINQALNDKNQIHSEVERPKLYFVLVPKVHADDTKKSGQWT